VVRNQRVMVLLYDLITFVDEGPKPWIGTQATSAVT